MKPSAPTWRILAVAFTILLGALGGMLAIAPSVPAVTVVQGSITADTTWGPPFDSEYWVVGNVIVRPGATLTIRPGTTVKFSPSVGLFVEGSLIADGTPFSPISFVPNITAISPPWIGIQFNTSTSGSISWSSIIRAERAVTAIDSSPNVHDNSVQMADWAFAFLRSNSVLADNRVDRSTLGVYMNASDVRVLRNVINATLGGIRIEGGGAPTIEANTITNVTSGFAYGIFASGGASPDIVDNTIDGVRGVRGDSGIAVGEDGRDAGFAAAILVDGSPSATVYGNRINLVLGGRGGDGQGNASGVGGRGGNGGPAAGIVVTGAKDVAIDANTITNVSGGRGGNGGGGALTATGGRGGNGGDAAAIELVVATSGASISLNLIDRVGAGRGGNGGNGTFLYGSGGDGGGVLGFAAWSPMDAIVSSNTFRNFLGGLGGNSSSTGTGNRFGGRGGDALVIAFFGVAGSPRLESNDLLNIIAGGGGTGLAGGGSGGNATGFLVFGSSDGRFNLTRLRDNSVQDVFGGDGGIGHNFGGAGGTATAAGLAFVAPSLEGNWIRNVQAGDGADALSGFDAGRGGDAMGVATILVRDSLSRLDSIDTILRGTPGAGGPVFPASGTGYYLEGNASFTARLTVENGTLASVDDRELAVGPYAQLTTINTPFSGAKVFVDPAGRLTVRNYLAVDAFWPNAATFVAGASIRVEDNGTAAWNFVTSTGSAQWLLVTDRVYNGSNVALDNTTRVTVSYLSYGFGVNPRWVDMAMSHTETFVMIDSDTPLSTAGPLPPFTPTSTFSVPYVASDGNGTGLSNITLYVRKDGGLWAAYATQPAASFGSFVFIASGDGTYEFTTVADDIAGNTEPGPAANDTWTIVDTALPGSHVEPLPTYTTFASFLVTWGPDTGVTDIASYRIQYNRGTGWIDWLVGTTLTSAIFTADPAAGVYEFRSIATDLAGNIEPTPLGNDTWTIVDVEEPYSRVLPLAAYQTTLTFLVSWGPDGDVLDIAKYRIDVNDNGAGWVPWMPSTTSTSATFTGVDGHTYEFRSIATDTAGNTEPTPLGNDTWTTVDVTLPDSTMSSLPVYTRSANVALAWGPEPGTTDIANYTVEVSDNGGPWTTIPALTNTTSTSGAFAAADGHRYAFRSISIDRAGNREIPPSGNDTWTIVDRTEPASSASVSGTAGSGGWYRSAVTVSLSATDATSGVVSTAYRIDGGPWQSYAVPIAVASEGTHTINFYSTDGAGNQEEPRSLVLRIDTVAPTTSISIAGTAGQNGWYLSSVVVTLTGADGSSGVGSTAYRLDGGAWLAYAAPFVVAGDGAHTVEYASTDVAGNAEATRSTAGGIDTIRPSVVSGAPRGANVNATSAITITFSEPMDQVAVEQAFSVNPDISGTFVWTVDSRTLTFTPDRSLDTSTTYVVYIDSAARDVAGNAMSAAYTFSFSTAAPPSGFAFVFADMWWLFLIVAAGVGAAILIARRRRAVAAQDAARDAAAAASKTPTAIDDVFLLYRDGILIKHETRRLKPDIDTDILSGMLTAVQQFVKDSFRTEEGELNELSFGSIHILIGRGKWLILAAMITGDETASMSGQIKRCVLDMEDHHWDQLEDWDGDMALAKVLAPYVKKLIGGEYLRPVSAKALVTPEVS